ncbi:unnamed protein product [Cladocopium goreaui]|uniref:Uncharacterized protein n=1 Tax=Cladocopium goreaui TaxID=2562237 RepID=A0A9P1DPL8_9DINO|nr:unnamed protein product [Cladocopium goreaui]
MSAVIVRRSTLESAPGGWLRHQKHQQGCWTKTKPILASLWLLRSSWIRGVLEARDYIWVSAHGLHRVHGTRKHISKPTCKETVGGEAYFEASRLRSSMGEAVSGSLRVERAAGGTEGLEDSPPGLEIHLAQGRFFGPDILTALAGRQAYPKRWTTLLRQRMWGGQMVQGASNMILKVFSWQNKANGYNLLQLWNPGVGCLWRQCIYYNFNLSSSSFHFCFPHWFARCLALFFHGRSTKNGETDARFEGSTVRPRGKDWEVSQMSTQLI